MRRVIVLGVLLVACASQEGPAKPEAPAGKTPPQGAATTGPREDASPWSWRSDAGPSATPTYLLGVMGQTGIEHCPDGGYDRKWLSLSAAIGRVSVSGPDDESVLEPLMDQPVLALGQPGEPPVRAEGAPAPATTMEPCEPMQMRSDWRLTPRGMLIERDPAPAPTHLRMDAVRPLHELTVRQEGDHVVATLTNPVPVALTDVELRTHYEGCFGKPGTRVETTAVGELGKGAQASSRMPVLTRRPDAPDGRSEFRAYSVQVVGRGEGVVIDLDVPLGRLGIEIECPRD